MKESDIKCDGRKSSMSHLHRRTAWMLFLCAVVLSLTILVAMDLDGTIANATAPATVIVKMLDTPPIFEPAEVTIHVGDTVKWENVGNSVHHATDDATAAIKPDDVANPAGAKPFDSGFIPPGASFMHTFTVRGTYKYVCAAHETSGMKGEVVVN